MAPHSSTLAWKIPYCWILVHWPLLMFGAEAGGEGTGFHFK